ncbi:MAG: hypothetical protein ACYC96_17050 [Fimbriimonadaceae bacterium]
MSNLLSPWGVCRFKAQAAPLPSSVTLTAAETAVWSFANAAAAFGSTAVTLSPTASLCAATLALGSFTNAPWQALALIVGLTLNWSGTGLASTQVTLVGVDGATVAIAAAPGTFGWPATPADAKYAGSWGQNFGVGFTASDTGSDALGTGISTSEMASAENSFAFQLLLGFTAAKLVFTFTLSDATKPIALHYPTFAFPAAAPAVIQETGDTAVVLYPNGPGVRYGSWAWWNGGSWQDPPAVRSFGQTPTALDWLAWKRVVTGPEAAETGLDAEIAGLYDTVEQSGRGDVAAGTNSFVVAANAQLTGVLVNSLSETPPLAVFPGKARDSALQPTGGYALESWSHTKGPRDIVSAQAAACLFDPGGNQWTTPLAGMPAGWAVSRYDRAVTNAEDAGFTIRANGETYARVSPWHGYSCVLLPAAGALPWMVQTDFGAYHLATVHAGDIFYKWSPFPAPLWQIATRVTTDGNWSNPRMCLDHRRRIELRAIQTVAGVATAHRFTSDDNGATWSPAE